MLKTLIALCSIHLLGAGLASLILAANTDVGGIHPALKVACGVLWLAVGGVGVLYVTKGAK